MPLSSEPAITRRMQLYCENEQRKISAHTWDVEQPIPDSVVWIDMLEPTPEEEHAAEKFLGINIPTREEMAEIEVSNRLYEEDGVLYITTTMLAKVVSGQPETHAVTFIITPKRLITVRYVDTTSFRRFAGLFTKTPRLNRCGVGTFLPLIEAIVNRMADILERVDRDVDAITRNVFRPKQEGDTYTSKDYQRILEHIGRCGDITAKIHESLVTFGRAMVFLSHQEALTTQEQITALNSIRADIAGLSDHGTHLAARCSFLLDATLGMISIQQNNVFRVLSIASLIFMPPTLVAGIYGMNFKLMPELDWHWGYPMAVILMLFAAILPVAYLRQRRFL